MQLNSNIYNNLKLYKAQFECLNLQLNHFSYNFYGDLRFEDIFKELMAVAQLGGCEHNFAPLPSAYFAPLSQLYQDILTVTFQESPCQMKTKVEFKKCK